MAPILRNGLTGHPLRHSSEETTPVRQDRCGLRMCLFLLDVTRGPAAVSSIQAYTGTHAYSAREAEPFCFLSELRRNGTLPLRTK